VDRRLQFSLPKTAPRKSMASRSLVPNSQALGAAPPIHGALLWTFGYEMMLYTVVIGFLIAVPVLQAQTLTANVISISVTGDDRQPLSGVTIEGRSDRALLCKAVTDTAGRAKLSGCGSSGELRLTARLDGYVSATTSFSVKDNNVIEIALSKTTAVQQSVEVHADSQRPLTESRSSESKLPMEDAKSTSLRPNTIVDALPLVPGVIRTPDGRVHVTGLDEEHSSLLINSVNVNDPATGDFGLSVPVDSVDILKVMQSPYLAQYGNFTAGVVSAETRRGSDKWSYSLNDPLPDFRIRSGHLVGLRDASPRLNFSGPLITNHLYFLEGSEYLINKDEVRTLPFPVNESRSNAFNSFTQLDAILGARNSITATLHFAPHTLRYENLNYFDPQPVTPNADYQEDTGTISEHFGFGGGVLASTFAGTRVATNVAGQDQGEMLLSPEGNSGNYFGEQSREATRFQWVETWNPANIALHGQHSLQIGTVLAHAEDEGQVADRDVRIESASGQLLRTISYDGNGTFSLSDLEFAAYAQDHWILDSHIAVDAGMRWESQSLTYTNRIAPRVGFAWTPRENNSTVMRGGLGVFYDAVPLDTYAFRNYPQQMVTTYDGNGNITDGPRRYLNVISTGTESEFPFIQQQIRSGNFAPYSVAWNIEGEQKLSQFFMFRVRYIHSDERNQLILTPQITSALSALVLGGSGALQSRQVDFTLRVGTTKQRQFFFSYVHQSARGDLTDASSYLGDFPFPVVRSQITASTSGEVPNRFLLWGTSVLPWRMRITPHIEYRNGFTWQPVDQLQNYIDFSPYLQPRYPRYFSADLRFAKDLNVGPRHAIRLSVTARNLTNHDNPLQIHGNVADPQFGTFFGNYGRHFLLDFDFLF
jgi:hypothetical protein